MPHFHQLTQGFLRCAALVFVLGLLSNSSSVQAQDYIWWEGENPKETNFPEKSSFTPANDQEKSHLSSGAWLSADGGRMGQPALFAKYEINVPKAGSYAFWTRKFWKHGPFKWRFDEQPWTVCPTGQSVEPHWAQQGILMIF